MRGGSERGFRGGMKSGVSWTSWAGRITAWGRKLARRFGVSEATISRDIAELREWRALLGA